MNVPRQLVTPQKIVGRPEYYKQRILECLSRCSVETAIEAWEAGLHDLFTTQDIIVYGVPPPLLDSVMQDAKSAYARIIGHLDAESVYSPNLAPAANQAVYEECSVTGMLPILRTFTLDACERCLAEGLCTCLLVDYSLLLDRTFVHNLCASISSGLASTKNQGAMELVVIALKPGRVVAAEEELLQIVRCFDGVPLTVRLSNCTSDALVRSFFWRLTSQTAVSVFVAIMDAFQDLRRLCQSILAQDSEIIDNLLQGRCRLRICTSTQSNSVVAHLVGSSRSRFLDRAFAELVLATERVRYIDPCTQLARQRCVNCGLRGAEHLIKKQNVFTAEDERDAGSLVYLDEDNEPRPQRGRSRKRKHIFLCELPNCGNSL